MCPTSYLSALYRTSIYITHQFYALLVYVHRIPALENTTVFKWTSWQMFLSHSARRLAAASTTRLPFRGTRFVTSRANFHHVQSPSSFFRIRACSPLVLNAEREAHILSHAQWHKLTWRASSSAPKQSSRKVLPRPPDKRHTPVTWASMTLAMVVSGGLVLFYNSEKERRQNESSMSSQTKTVGKALIGGPWSLFDSNGKLCTDADFRGHFQFVYFGFTKCPDICPNELVKIGKIFDTLESDPNVQGQVKPIFISIDPRRDTIAQLQEYRQDFHPAFTWLTGAPEQINAVAKAFRVYWSKVDVTTDEDDDDGYSVDHTIVTYLMGPDGQFLDLFTSGVDAKETVERIKKHVSA